MEDEQDYFGINKLEVEIKKTLGGKSNKKLRDYLEKIIKYVKDTNVPNVEIAMKSLEGILPVRLGEKINSAIFSKAFFRAYNAAISSAEEKKVLGANHYITEMNLFANKLGIDPQNKIEEIEIILRNGKPYKE